MNISAGGLTCTFVAFNGISRDLSCFFVVVAVFVIDFRGFLFDIFLKKFILMGLQCCIQVSPAAPLSVRPSVLIKLIFYLCLLYNLQTESALHSISYGGFSFVRPSVRVAI